jgi:cytochrome b
MKKIQVWDLPIRLFHWALAVMIVVCIYTINEENITAHQYAGVFVLILLLFRVIWGLIGSSTAKFWDFLKGPVSIYNYLRYGVSKTEGHNPMGAYMVLFMLVVLLVQTITGLFLTDNTYLHQDSPLYKLISGNTRSYFKTIHQYNLYVIYVMVGLHIAAILGYFFFKGQNLVKTMIVGSRKEREWHSPMAKEMSGNKPWLALIIIIALGVIVPYMLYGYMKNIEFIVWIKNTALWLKGLLF